MTAKIIWTAEDIMTKHFRINIQKDNSKATNNVLSKEFLDVDEVIRIINALTVCGKIDRKELLERLK